MKEDHFTNTEADAAAYERHCIVPDYGDDRPTLAELQRDEAYYDYDLTLDELVEACDDCDGTHFMCSEHRHLSKVEEDEQAAKWRREDDLDARDADREHRAEDDSLWVEP
jgi:hypothetical protein